VEFQGGLVGVNAGDLHDRVQLECDDITRVNGAEVRTPRVFATCWANVDFTGGGEVNKDHSVQARRQVRVTIRYREDVMEQHRVIHDGKRYEIKGVMPEQQRKTQVVLECWSI
jgi:SPP1 family predicted phage head-tail adaptor